MASQGMMTLKLPGAKKPVKVPKWAVPVAAGAAAVAVIYFLKGSDAGGSSSADPTSAQGALGAGGGGGGGGLGDLFPSGEGDQSTTGGGGASGGGGGGGGASGGGGGDTSAQITDPTAVYKSDIALPDVPDWVYLRQAEDLHGLLASQLLPQGDASKIGQLKTTPDRSTVAAAAVQSAAASKNLSIEGTGGGNFNKQVALVAPGVSKVTQPFVAGGGGGGGATGFGGPEDRPTKKKQIEKTKTTAPKIVTKTTYTAPGGTQISTRALDRL